VVVMMAVMVVAVVVMAVVVMAVVVMMVAMMVMMMMAMSMSHGRKAQRKSGGAHGDQQATTQGFEHVEHYFHSWGWRGCAPRGFSFPVFPMGPLGPAHGSHEWAPRFTGPRLFFDTCSPPCDPAACLLPRSQSAPPPMAAPHLQRRHGAFRSLAREKGGLRQNRRP
jgi:hypothetical protein